MGLAGAGAVAIWHDVMAEGKDEFYAWHGQQHMPERVGIAGFLRGRRYIALNADLEYFNLYEAETPDVLTGSEYKNRLNNPTPWTLSTVTHYRKVARSICRVAATFGSGQGGLMTTVRYDVPDDRADDHIQIMADTVLPEIMKHNSVCGVHLIVTDTEASSVDTAERKQRNEENTIPRWIVLVEGWGEELPFAELCRLHLSDQKLAATGVLGNVDLGVYRLEFSLDHSDVG
jgi:hypothetical protein